MTIKKKPSPKKKQLAPKWKINEREVYTVQCGFYVKEPPESLCINQTKWQLIKITVGQ